MHYNKQSIPLPQQIQRLKSRGLGIADEPAAEHHLRNISYYRLAGYWWPMQSDKVNHVFKPNSRFDDVIALYNFDSHLRLLVFKAIGRIEIGLRTRMINHLSEEIDPWWFENPAIFIDQKAFTTNIDSLDRELRKSREIFRDLVNTNIPLIIPSYSNASKGGGIAYEDFSAKPEQHNA